MADPAVEIAALTKVFPGGVVAVNGLDLAVPRGAVFGMLGRNGAGKTMVLRLLLGLLRPSRGTARLLGAEWLQAPRAQRARATYVPQILQLHGWMTLEELGLYAAQFYERWDEELARRLAGRFALPWRRQLGLLSGGQQRLAALLLALAPRPEILLLDEPAAGLDPLARRQLLEELVEALARAAGCTVLFSTHLVADLERVADRIGILDRGRLLLSAPLADIQERTRRVQVIFPGAAPPAGFRVPGALRTSVSGAVVEAVARLADESALDEIRRLPGVRVQTLPLGLEDLFVEFLEQDAPAPSPEVQP